MKAAEDYVGCHACPTIAASETILNNNTTDFVAQTFCCICVQAELGAIWEYCKTWSLK